MNDLKIFISGPPASGKTTMVKSIWKIYKEFLVGFWTEEIRESNRRIGFKIVTTWGTQSILASITNPSKYKLGKYFVYPANLDLVVSELKNILQLHENKILIIDEIGPMEMHSKEFKQFITDILKNSKINLIATVHRHLTNIIKPYKYLWLTREKWWIIYKNIKRKIELWLNTKL